MCFVSINFPSAFISLLNSFRSGEVNRRIRNLLFDNIGIEVAQAIYAPKIKYTPLIFEVRFEIELGSLQPVAFIKNPVCFLSGD